MQENRDAIEALTHRVDNLESIINKIALALSSGVLHIMDDEPIVCVTPRNPSGIKTLPQLLIQMRMHGIHASDQKCKDILKKYDIDDLALIGFNFDKIPLIADELFKGI